MSKSINWWIRKTIAEKKDILLNATKDGYLIKETIDSLNSKQVEFLFNNYNKPIKVIKTTLKPTKETIKKIDVDNLSELEKINLIQELDSSLNKSFIKKVALRYSNNVRRSMSWDQYLNTYYPKMKKNEA